MEEKAEGRRRPRTRCDGAAEHRIRNTERLGIGKNHEHQHTVEAVFYLEEELVPGPTERRGGLRRRRIGHLYQMPSKSRSVSATAYAAARRTLVGLSIGRAGAVAPQMRQISRDPIRAPAAASASAWVFALKY